MMRLTENNIKFVKENWINDKIVSYYVGMKSNHVSDGRIYYVSDIKDLPKTIQKYLEKSVGCLWSEDENDGNTYTVYIF